MTDVQPTIKEVAQAFSSHGFEQTYEHLADGLVWVNVGGETYEGKPAVMAACKAALDYFKTIESTLGRLDVLEGESFVVVKSQGSYVNKGETTIVESCDIYEFESGKVIGITSYNVDTTN